jgi:probable phosphoglycerate mutase
VGGVTKILLTRHGHVDGINPKRFRGRAELPLTELGLKQAERLGARIARQWTPVAIYTSGLQRCVVTAGQIAVASGTAAAVLDGLMDLDYGDWQGRVQDEVRQEVPDLFEAWHITPQLMRFPKGESLQELVARVAEALRSVLGRHPGQTVVMVGHDSVNRALLLQLIDQPLSAYWKLAQDPCCLNEIDIERGRVEVRRVNDTSHLD